MFTAFVYGFFLAFSLILPLGPQNMFILNEGSKAQRFVQILPVVLTAGICDSLLIVLAIVGVESAVEFFNYPYVKNGFVTIGVIFLLYMSWRSLKSAKKQDEQSATQLPVASKILYTMAFSIINPHAVIDSIMVIGSSALSYLGNDRIAYATACIIVSWLWFFMLALLGKKLSGIKNFRVNLCYISATIMCLCALLLIKNNLW